MTDLEFDTEAFHVAAAQYHELSNNIIELKNKLAEELRILTTEKWKSDAANAYMKKYENTWAENVQEYVNLINHLEEILKYAELEYSQLAERIEDIRID